MPGAELTENELIEERVDLLRATYPNREQRVNGINVWYRKASDFAKEASELINEELTTDLETPVWPEIYEANSYRIRENLKDRNFMFLLASSLETSLETSIAVSVFNALHLTVCNWNRVLGS